MSFSGDPIKRGSVEIQQFNGDIQSTSSSTKSTSITTILGGDQPKTVTDKTHDKNSSKIDNTVRNLWIGVAILTVLGAVGTAIGFVATKGESPLPLIGLGATIGVGFGGAIVVAYMDHAKKCNTVHNWMVEQYKQNGEKPLKWQDVIHNKIIGERKVDYEMVGETLFRQGKIECTDKSIGKFDKKQSYIPTIPIINIG